MSPSMNEVYQLWMVLHRTSDAFVKLKDSELAQYGISAAVAGVLVIVHDMAGRATAGSIARLTLREPHSVSMLLARMENKGLITKRKDPDRRSIVRLSLTEKGLRAYRQAQNLESARDILLMLPDEEIGRLKESLQVLHDGTIRRLRLGPQVVSPVIGAAANE